MITRRRFLYHGCAASAASMSAGSMLAQLGAARCAAADASMDYRALVCILLAGGNDAFNMLVPVDREPYEAYRRLRTDLALPREDLLPLAAPDTLGRSFGLHPAMEGLRSLFAEDRAALVANVGTLLAPVDLPAMANGSWPMPLGLFSHSDQIEQWQTAVVDDRSALGWGGRLADFWAGSQSPGIVPMNISLTGSNIFQGGARTTPYVVTTSEEGASSLAGYTDESDGGRYLRYFVDRLFSGDQDRLLARSYRDILVQALEMQQSFSAALSEAPPLATEFGADDFSRALRQVARIISVREALGATRQTFFIAVGGWDHHDDLLDNQAAMLPPIDRGLTAFQRALDELAMRDAVTTFTTSDFARTLTSNGRGSDHGWGGHHIVVGGSVNGGAIYGEYPDLHEGNPLDVGRGSYAPTLSVDEYFAELALWFGVAPRELPNVLPNLPAFYDPASGSRPIGFLRS